MSIIATHICEFTNIDKYDSDGYDIEGYNILGYDIKGYNKYGYDRYGNDRYGYNKDGYNVDGFTKRSNIPELINIYNKINEFIYPQYIELNENYILMDYNGKTFKIYSYSNIEYVGTRYHIIKCNIEFSKNIDKFIYVFNILYSKSRT